VITTYVGPAAAQPPLEERPHARYLMALLRRGVLDDRGVLVRDVRDERGRLVSAREDRAKACAAPRLPRRTRQAAPPPRPGVVRQAVRAAARAFGVRGRDVTSRRRSYYIALARHAAIAAVYEVTGATLEGLGCAFRRDSATVLHALRRIAALRRDPEIDAAITAIAEEARRG